MKFAALGIIMSLAAAPVLARDVGEFPAATDGASVAAWLDARTNIKPASVVAVTPGFVIALVAAQKPLSPEGPMRVTLREEVIAPAFVDAVGGRSALMTVQIQCEERRLRMDGRNLYTGPNLSGAKSVDDPSIEWLRIPEDTVMDEVANAACEPDYVWPLQAYASATPVVAVQTPPSPPAAASEAPVVAEVKPAAPEVNTEAPPKLAEQAAPERVAIAEAKPAEPVAPPKKAEAPPQAEEPTVRYAIQIGAYRNQAMAETAWKALSTERPILTQGHDFDVRPVTVKDKKFLRGLILNFKSPQEGAAFCTALAGTGYGCILRVLRD